ncbi:MAG: VanZ family protein [Fervidobacterium sp.]|uniref:VanZ family protein n=1 Tax=Fervidobacterium sp. TaxID=1871331 RepID=UPI00404B2D3F
MVDKKLKILTLSLFCIVLFWLGLIYYFSTRGPVESMRQSQFAYRVIKKLDSIFDFSSTVLFTKVERKLKQWWFGTENIPAEMVIRKSAHFGLYFVFAFLISVAFYTWKKSFLISFLLGFTIPSTYAIFDEYNQIFYMRGSSLNDVIIDSTGAFFGSVFSAFVILSLLLIKKLKAMSRYEER